MRGLHTRIRCCAPERAGGFTLLEILMVVVLVGIISTITLLSMSLGDESRRMNEELRRIDRLVTLARDETVFRMLDLGLEFAGDGYRFVAWDGQRWSTLPDPGPFRRRHWPPGVEVRLDVDGEPASLPAALGDDRVEPQVMILSSGDVTPFALYLETDGDGGHLAVGLDGATERHATEVPAG